MNPYVAQLSGILDAKDLTDEERELIEKLSELRAERK